MQQHSLIHARIMLPQVGGELPSSRANHVKVGWRGIITKCAAHVNHTIVTLDKGMHRHAVGVIAHEVESATDVIISNVDLQIRIGNAQVVEPHHEPHFSPSEGQWGLVIFVSPVIDGKAPRERSEAAIEDRTGLLIRRVNIH
jgi:hypothetical protein